MGEVEKSEFSENSETSENQFPRFSTPSFPFCTIPKTENSEMKTSECCLFTKLRVFHFALYPKRKTWRWKPRSALSSIFTKLRVFPIPSFPFCTIPKTENLEMKTSEYSFKPFYQTPSFSNSEFSILRYTQNGKLGVGNLGVFSKVYQNSDLLNYLIKLRVFHFALH